jgi:hypothetical protein
VIAVGAIRASSTRPRRRRIRAGRAAPDRIRTERCSLTNEAEVAASPRLADDGEHVDGLVPLVGGWRGGGGLAGQTEEDYRAFEQAFTAVRVTSRAFDADLRASEAAGSRSSPPPRRGRSPARTTPP